MRLFLALPFPAAVRDVLLDAQAQLRAQGVRAGFTRAENFHLTLAFLGETDRESEIRRLLDAVGAPAFPLTVGGFGRFGDLYWAGVGRSAALEALALDLQNGLRGLGFPIETRPFRPHITLARQAAAPRAPRLEIPETGMTADRVLLMQSHRVRGILTYTPLHEKKLKTSP